MRPKGSDLSPLQNIFRFAKAVTVCEGFQSGCTSRNDYSATLVDGPYIRWLYFRWQILTCHDFETEIPAIYDYYIQ
jgi:hypothetical protein